MERQIGHDTAAPADADSAEQRITHFIPSVQLTGTRAETLRTLETLILHLEQLRQLFASDAPPATYQPRTRAAVPPSWPWFTSGAAIAGILVLLFALAARGCA